MHWKTRGYYKVSRSRRHLGDDGEECGCYSTDSADGWGGHKHRTRIICDTHVKRQEVRLKRSNRHDRAEDEYNRDTEQRIKKFTNFRSKTNCRYFRELKRELSTIEDDLVPIKYLYERGCSGDDMKDRVNVQKIRGRYYCCKNKVIHYKKWEDKMVKEFASSNKRFMEVHGWTEDDMVLREYQWIKTNDNAWLKKYKSLKMDVDDYIPPEGYLTNVDNGVYETDGEYETDGGYIPKDLR